MICKECKAKVEEECEESYNEESGEESYYEWYVCPNCGVLDDDEVEDGEEE